MAASGQTSTILSDGMNHQAMAESAPAVSRRGALRLSGCDHLVAYRTAFEDGSALLLNISTDGCAIGQATVELSEGEKILLTLGLDSDKSEIQIQAKVVRVTQWGYGLRFRYLNDRHKRRILLYFSRQNRLQRNHDRQQQP